MAQERILTGCATYVVGDYHFNEGQPLPVADEHVEYIDSLTDRHGDPLFAAEAPKTERKSVTISKGGKKQQQAPQQAEGAGDGDETATV